ncbi:Hypothetical predicted protein [Marmota monax]|uniref:Uncharacterized protein n=1 Tax=Marmota monax TaxID=9995 RepID=A0A5E4A5I5_MARMO|nr:Hypothetical predicted protein [Marmota monax]
MGNIMLPGDSFVETLSGKTVWLQGVSQQEDRTLPHMGGSQALLDANVLVAQRQVIAVLQQCQESPGWRAQELLEAAIKDMKQALALSLHHILQQARRLARQLEAAHGIEASGGRIGMMCYPGTELWVSALYGMEIPDPEGSGLMVPILGMEQDGNSGNATPLAGSMEDADGKADREEWEEEAQVALGMQEVLQSLRQGAEKLRQASGRLQGQEEEVWLQQGRNQSPQVWNRPRKVLQHLSDEFQERVREKQNFLDKALGQLQYQRELSRLQFLHSQIIASGSPICLENYPGDRFYGRVTTYTRDHAATCPLLIPFLKSLTAVLVGDQGLDLEDQKPGADADKVDTIQTSPLFSILKKIDIWSQAHKEGVKPQVHHKPDPKSSLQDLRKTQTVQKEELTTVPSTDLSAREFVVYQYGLSILDLLVPQLHAPEITLQIASRLPSTEASDNAFQGSFFYQYIKKNKDLLLFTNMEHFLKSILAAEKQMLRIPKNQFGDKDKI